MVEATDNDVTVLLTYDGLGRTTSETSGPNPISTYGMTTSYAYDKAYRLTKALMGTEDPGAGHASPGSEVYDHRILYNLTDDSDRTSVVTNPHVDDDDTSELVRLYLHVDPRTNVAFLTGPDESVIESCEYDPYGSIGIRDQAGDPVAASPVGNPFSFQRRRLDAETGLYYFRARHYDPVAGQWMQRDPLGLRPGANWREFCSSSPIVRGAPMGREDRLFIDGDGNVWWEDPSLGVVVSDADARAWGMGPYRGGKDTAAATHAGDGGAQGGGGGGAAEESGGAGGTEEERSGGTGTKGLSDEQISEAANAVAGMTAMACASIGALVGAGIALMLFSPAAIPVGMKWGSTVGSAIGIWLGWKVRQTVIKQISGAASAGGGR